jgi:hypothetical protein
MPSSLRKVCGAERPRLGKGPKQPKSVAHLDQGRGDGGAMAFESLTGKGLDAIGVEGLLHERSQVLGTPLRRELGGHNVTSGQESRFLVRSWRLPQASTHQLSGRPGSGSKQQVMPVRIVLLR